MAKKKTVVKRTRKSKSGATSGNGLAEDELVQQLEKAIGPILTRYLAQMTPEQAAAEKEADRIAKMIEKEGANSIPGKALAAARKELLAEADDSTFKEAQAKRAAKALKAAAGRHGVKLALGTASTGAGSTRTGKRSRLSAAEMSDAAEKVLKALPAATTADDQYMRVNAVAEKAGVDPGVAKSALGKLKRDGRAESNGVRGPGGGWRKTGK